MDRQHGSSQLRRVTNVLAILVVCAGAAYASAVYAVPAVRRQEGRTFCRIAHVLAYSEEFDLAMVAVGPYLPDSVMMMTLPLAAMPAPSYPGAVLCAQPRTVPEP